MNYTNHVRTIIRLALLLLTALPVTAQQSFPATHAGVLRSSSAVPVRAEGLMVHRLDRTAMTLEYRATIAELAKTISGGALGRILADTVELVRTFEIGGGSSGTFTGLLAGLTAADVAMIDSGLGMFVLTTEQDPGGYVRGKIETVGSLVVIEFDPVDSESWGRGEAWFIVEGATRTARYAVSWRGLTGTATTGAIVSRAAGSGSTPLHEFAIGADSIVLGNWERLRDSDLASMRAGDLQIVIRSDSFPSGEIAGALLPLDFFAAAIEPGNEVPPIGGSTLRGTGYGFVFTVPDNPSQITFRSTVVGANVTSAHVHRGDSTEVGDVFRALEARSTGDWELEGDTTTSIADITLLRGGRMYMNYHTGDFPDGEARGQLIPSPTNLNGMTISSVRPEVEAATVLSAFVDRANGSLRFAVERPIAGARIDLYNTLGALVASTALDGDMAAIDVGALARGAYIAQLVAGSRAIARCVITR